MKRILIMFLFLFTCVCVLTVHAGEQKTSDTVAGARMVKTVDGIEYAFRWCPAGSFTMGSPSSEPDRDDDETQHSVTLTRGFWMLETEVTQAMWKSVMGTDPSRFKGVQNPVECVSWDDCQEFCRKLSSQLGLTVSLPTEAQWEYACRAGTTSAYSFGSSLNGREANCDGNYPYGTSTKGPYLEKTVPVKSYAPNAWGLYDMHGNVWEWCQDWYDEDYYAESPTSDPCNEDSSSGSDRVRRGGSWLSIAQYCRSADRFRDTPDYRNYGLGFRPVLAAPAASISEPVPPPGPTEESTPETTQLSESSGSFHTAGERMVKTVDGIEYAFRWCPAGTFTMGSPSSEPDRDDDETQHSVTLTRGFWMLETEVTQAMWKSVMGTDPSWFKGAQNPVESVSWKECDDFCKKLSSQLGLTVSLPTEAQWEYACRAGTTGAYAGDLGEMGWYDEDWGTGSTHPVGQKKPNAWGLYDMHGNVWEWCQDWYDEDYYTESPTSDPTGPSSGWRRVGRGGSWRDSAQFCRSALRNGDSPGRRINGLGFRPVLAAPAASISEPVPPPGPTEESTPETTQLSESSGSFHTAGERMVKTVDGIEYAFRWCPPGTFLMGSPEDEPGRNDGETQHRVTLTQGFWMLETEVTQAMWESVMGTTLEEQAQKMLHDDTEYDFVGVIGKKTLRDLLGLQRDEDPAEILAGVGSDRPMYYVSWNECEEFCRKLSSKLGMTVSLPTEAQWEYACRAGSETALPNGPIEILGLWNAPALDPIAWYGGNSAQDFTGTSRWNSSSWPEMQYPGGPFGVHPVRKKEANAWGLRDMIGNVYEWCQDWYDSDYYAASPTSDPTGPNSGSDRVNRGGSWGDDAQYCRSARRNGFAPDVRIIILGFRPVLASPVPEE